MGELQLKRMIVEAETTRARRACQVCAARKQPPLAWGGTGQNQPPPQIN
jgi:hypothetical protein